MTPKPLQKGCWPDGTVGVKAASFCPEPSCSDIPGVAFCSHGLTGEPRATVAVPVLPVELVEGLAEALEPVAAQAHRLEADGLLEVEDLANDPDLTYPADIELSVSDLRAARSALASYRQALGEGQ